MIDYLEEYITLEELKVVKYNFSSQDKNNFNYYEKC